MAINVRINLAVVLATVVGILVSIAWQSDALPWGRYEDHYLITAVCAHFALALILEWITSTHWGLRKWQDAAWLGIYVTLIYAVLSAPQSVSGLKSLFAFGFICLHKLVVVSAMTLTIFLVKKNRY